MLFFTGFLVEIALFGAWTADAVRVDGLQLASLAQTFMIVGAELGFGAFLVVTILAHD